MISQSRLSRAARLLLMASVPVLLTACAGDLMGPSAMPSGYASQTRSYDAPQGPDAMMHYPGEEKIGVRPQAASAPAPENAPAAMQAMPVTPVTTDTMSTTTTTTTTAMAPVTVGPQWDAAADDLLEKMEKNYGRLTEPVYVRAPADGNMDEAMFRQALGDALDHRHYKVSTNKPHSHFAFDYSVTGNADGKGHTQLTLATFAFDRKADQESGLYDLNASAASATPAPVQSTAPAPADKPIPVLAPDESKPAAMSTTTTTTTTSSASNSAPPAMIEPAPSMPSLKEEAGKIAGEDTAPAQTPESAGSDRVYIYDGHAHTGKTAYEERMGTGHSVPEESENAPAQSPAPADSAPPATAPLDTPPADTAMPANH